ncbi:MAG: HAD-IC family P-type ATPase [Oscillospiraceae bacterium]|nr:HAD-IC family P-type ATPase [Oscillospiraceae bacterium]
MKIDPSWPALSSEEAVRLANEGKANVSPSSASKSEKQIILSNLFTFYNMLNLVLAVLVITTGSFRNMLFMGIVISNFLIGTIQELRAKRTVDSLSVLTAPTARAIRDGKEVVLPCKELVLGDVVLIGAGDQITADGTVLGGEARLNESLITGESDAVLKEKGDKLFSGSFVISGECAVLLTAVGAESYAEKLTAEAKKLKTAKSVLKSVMEKIIKTVTVFIVPMGVLTFWNHYVERGLSYVDSMIPTVAAMVGMIPDGLYLLTSMSFAVGVVRLAQKRTLTQQLYSLESLARADVLCLDKTGTITSGNMKIKGTVSFEGDDIGAIAAEIYSAVPADNVTAKTIVEAFGSRNPIEKNALHTLPFSSALKYAAADFGDEGCFMIGAPEFVLGEGFDEIKKQASEYSADGTRVLALCEGKFDGKLYKAEKPLGFILIEDEIRPNVAETFEYFRKNDVAIKVISGDNPFAVSAIAKKAGVIGAENFLDASVLSDEELSAAAEKTVVFGRVSPEQKRVIIKALQSGGHTVAMTGDGVNDVLALKDADCSVAMASGAQAASHAAQLVLLDSDFSAMPEVVLEGRRVINNIQRAAAIFLMKTIYTFALTATLLFVPFAYPFAPIQMTLIGAAASGIPGIFLALEPNFRRVPKDFMKSVLKRAAIGAVTVFAGIMAVLIINENLGISAKLFPEEVSTVCTVYTGTASLFMLLATCMPLNKFKAAIVIGSTVIFFGGISLFSELFMLAPLSAMGRTLLLCLVPFTLIQLFIRGRQLRKEKE